MRRLGAVLHNLTGAAFGLVSLDGDVIFALATCHNDAATDVLQLGALAALAVERACVRAIQKATSLGGVPTAAEWAHLPA